MFLLLFLLLLLECFCRSWFEKAAQGGCELAVALRIQSQRRQIAQKIRFVGAAEGAWDGAFQQQFQFQSAAIVTHSTSNPKGAGFRRLWEAYLTYQHI